MIHDRTRNPYRGRYYKTYPTLDAPTRYVIFRYDDISDTVTEQIHLRQTLDATKTTKTITSDTQIEFCPKAYVLIDNELYQISSYVSRKAINPDAMLRRYRYTIPLTKVENPLELKG